MKVGSGVKFQNFVGDMNFSYEEGGGVKQIRPTHFKIEQIMAIVLYLL